jgi:hypothetical protein
MVIQGPLEFDFLLGRDYVYAMKVVVSTLFRVMHFPHNGNIVTIDQFLFVGPDLTVEHPTPLNVPYMQVVSPHHRLIMWHHVPCLQLLMRRSLSLNAQLL